MSETITTITRACRKCGDCFELEVTGRRVRELCDKCRRSNNARAAKRWRDQGCAPPAGRFAGTTLESVSAVVRMPVSTVENIERKGLAALRSNPELARLYRDWVAAGMPRPASDSGDQLLQFQLQVVEWYDRLTDLILAGVGEVAPEIVREVDKCQRAIGEELRKAHGTISTSSR